ncbi:MAG: hypothetical protein MJK18_05975, partial [Bdellovibrionales bacterium]|nr:hypothetical protein [Bdellovibrionales bacterium]
MVFRISDDGATLEGLEVNVDKPNVSDWQTLFTIPITQHYFYERVVDSRGRELNQFAKVSNRKNWQLQPYMDLDLKRISVVNRRKSPLVLWSPYSLWSSSFLSDVHDIEFTVDENGKHFLGFTGTQISSIFGSDIQHEIRFNFLEFEGTRGFKPTAYDPDTVSNKMNILHILGTREDGINEKNYAAHWDMSKPIEVCLNGFPENGRYKQIGVEVLNEVNKSMREIGTLKEGQQGFVVSQKEYKYDFDLRCPNIHWVNDPELSFGAPLGIGLVNTNVKTGEILWGSAIVWGGLIDFLVNRDSESPVDALARNSYEVISSIQDSKHKPYYSDINHQLEMPDINNFRALGELPELNNPEELKTLFKDMMRARLEEVSQTNAVDANRAQAMQLEELSELIGLEEGVTEINEHFQNQSVIDQVVASGQNIDVLRTQRMDQFINQKYNEIVAALPGNLNNDQHEIYRDFQQNEAQYKRALLRKSELGNSVTYSDEEQTHRNLVVNQENPEELRSKIKEDLYHKMSQGLDWDNTIAHHYGEWLQATAEMSMPEREEAAIGVIKNVMLHEWGHVLGLG